MLRTCERIAGRCAPGLVWDLFLYVGLVWDLLCVMIVLLFGYGLGLCQLRMRPPPI